MNPLGHLRAHGRGRRVFLIGNGPSLRDTPMDRLDGDSIAMNRIDLLWERDPSIRWRPTLYLFASHNCVHPEWGPAWSRSVVNCANQEGTTPIIYRRYRQAIEYLGGRLPAKTIFLDAVTESPIGSPQAFSTDPVLRLDKAGTSMVIALQIALYMDYDQTILLGCDSNWQTATATTLRGDPNHFDPGYHAHIGDGAHEFQRMNQTHLLAARHFQAADKEILNATPGSAITAYPRVPLEDVLD